MVRDIALPNVGTHLVVKPMQVTTHCLQCEVVV